MKVAGSLKSCSQLEYDEHVWRTQSLEAKAWLGSV